MIAVIVINYKNEEKTIGFVRDELAKIQTRHFVVVVDNGSTEESQRKLLEAFKGSDQIVFVVPSEENLGFAKGNNLGFQVAMSQGSPETILFSNNDIRINEVGDVEKLEQKLSELPEAGIIGPKVIGLDGHLQSPEPFLPFWKRHIWAYWSTLFMSKSARRKSLMLDYADNAAEGWHYRVSGSFFMVRAKDYEACGGMDAATFLYAEEMILSERMKRIGKGVYYYPAVSIVHEHGDTTRKYYDEVRIRQLKYASDSYYYRTYIGTPKWQLLVADLTYSLKRLFRR